MPYMFQVRFSPYSAPVLSRPFPCTLLAPLSPPPASCLPARTSPRVACYFDSWQDAWSFNQPLTLDTSSVKDMGDMFWVHSARGLTPI